MGGLLAGDLLNALANEGGVASFGEGLLGELGEGLLVEEAEQKRKASATEKKYDQCAIDSRLEVLQGQSVLEDSNVASCDRVGALLHVGRGRDSSHGSEAGGNGGDGDLHVG